MRVIGWGRVERLLADSHYQFKVILNEHGAIFLPVSEQHRDATAEGISYRDNYQGNALAAVVTSGLIEVRYHAAFDDARVRGVITVLVAEPQLSALAGFRVTYQGRQLH